MDKLKEIYDRIQTFDVSCATDKAGDDIQGILNAPGERPGQEARELKP